MGPNNVGSLPYCLSTRSLCLYVVGVTKKFPILNVVSMHRTDAGRNCVVQNRTKSLSCLSLATMHDGSGVTWTRLINGFNSLASSLDILINSHICLFSALRFA